MDANAMDWKEALEVMVARTKHEPYRVLCADGYPQHEVWRQRVIARATGKAVSPVPYPPLIVQAANFAGSAARIIASAVQGKPVLVSDEVHAQRLAICMACEFNGKRESGGVKCKKCGCGGAKLTFAAMACPDKPPRWMAVTDPPASLAEPG